MITHFPPRNLFSHLQAGIPLLIVELHTACIAKEGVWKGYGFEG